MIRIHLIDGDTILETKLVQDEAEYEQLERETVEWTGGNFHWISDEELRANSEKMGLGLCLEERKAILDIPIMDDNHIDVPIPPPINFYDLEVKMRSGASSEEFRVKFDALNCIIGLDDAGRDCVANYEIGNVEVYGEDGRPITAPDWVAFFGEALERSDDVYAIVNEAFVNEKSEPDAV